MASVHRQSLYQAKEHGYALQQQPLANDNGEASVLKELYTIKCELQYFKKAGATKLILHEVSFRKKKWLQMQIDRK